MSKRNGKTRQKATSSKASKLEVRRNHWEKLRSNATNGVAFEAANKRPGTSDCKK